MIDQDLPKPTLEEVLPKLRNLPDFLLVIEYVKQEREDMIGRFASVINDGEAMKTAGGVAMADRIWTTLQG